MARETKTIILDTEIIEELSLKALGLYIILSASPYYIDFKDRETLEAFDELFGKNHIDITVH